MSYSQEAQGNIDKLEKKFCEGFGYPENFFEPIYFETIHDLVMGLRSGAPASDWTDGMKAIGDILYDPKVGVDGASIALIYEVLAEVFRRYRIILNNKRIRLSKLWSQIRYKSKSKNIDVVAFSRYLASNTAEGKRVGMRLRTAFRNIDAAGDIELMLQTCREMMEFSDLIDWRAKIEAVKVMSFLYLKILGVPEDMQQPARKRLPAAKSPPEEEIIEGDFTEDNRPDVSATPGINDPGFRDRMSKISGINANINSAKIVTVYDENEDPDLIIQEIRKGG